MIRRILSLVFVTILVVGVGAATYLLSVQMSSYPEAMAEFRVESGQATVSINGEESVVTPDDMTPARIGTGGVIKTDGAGILNFIGTAIELAPGTEMILKRYLSRESEAQIDLELIKGQIMQRISGYSNPRSLYTLSAGDSLLVTRGGQFLSHRNEEGMTWHVSALGTADVTAKSQSVRLQTSMGTYISPNQPPTFPIVWGQVKVPTYKPDGTPFDLSVQMVNQRTSESFTFVSNDLFLVPAGTYRLHLTTLVTHTLENLRIAPNTFQEFPITLSEVVFNLVSGEGETLNYTTLTLKGDLEEHAVPNTPVLVPPGKNRIVVSRAEKPELLQPIDLDVLPGQQILLPVRDDLFGGGTLKVNLGAVEDAEVDPLMVNVFAADDEDGVPVDTFQTDGTSRLLPPGEYVVVVITHIAGRYPASLEQNEHETIDIPLGNLDVDYFDQAGSPVTRNVFIFIASMGEMRRMGRSVEEMRSTRYGIALAVTKADRLLVPAGSYTILVDDRVDITRESVEVPSGGTVVVQIQEEAQSQ